MKTLAEVIRLATFRSRNPKAVNQQPTRIAHAHGARLTRRWIRDPQSGRLICVWRSDDEGDMDGRLRVSPLAA